MRASDFSTDVAKHLFVARVGVDDLSGFVRIRISNLHALVAQSIGSHQSGWRLTDMDFDLDHISDSGDLPFD